MLNTIKVNAQAVVCAINDFLTTNSADDIVTNDVLSTDVQLPNCYDFDRYAKHLRNDKVS